MTGTADMVVSVLLHSPPEKMALHNLKRIDAQLSGAYTALLTHGYTPFELQPLSCAMVSCSDEIVNRYCGRANGYHDYV